MDADLHAFSSVISNDFSASSEKLVELFVMVCSVEIKQGAADCTGTAGAIPRCFWRTVSGPASYSTSWSPWCSIGTWWTQRPMMPKTWYLSAGSIPSFLRRRVAGAAIHHSSLLSRGQSSCACCRGPRWWSGQRSAFPLSTRCLEPCGTQSGQSSVPGSLELQSLEDLLQLGDVDLQNLRKVGQQRLRLLHSLPLDVPHAT